MCDLRAAQPFRKAALPRRENEALALTAHASPQEQFKIAGEVKHAIADIVVDFPPVVCANVGGHVGSYTSRKVSQNKMVSSLTMSQGGFLRKMPIDGLSLLPY